MKLPLHKTKIVCTIGPASRSKPVLRRLLEGGMNVARLNLSHGSLQEHARDIRAIRETARGLGKVCAILLDLPGPKIRVGELAGGGVSLSKGQEVVLTSRGGRGSSGKILVEYPQLAKGAKRGDLIHIGDGFARLRIASVSKGDVRCRVLAGGNLTSHKGLSLPDSRVHLEPVTRQDLELVDFGLSQGVSLFAVSFVEKGADLRRIRAVAHACRKKVRLIAKIERAEAMDNFHDILKEADGVMVARGDLGIHIPLEDVPVAQKWLIHETKLTGKPAITATQMLASMTENPQPTRAEATDVANAIVDGTDAVMLSEETAVGRYPVEAVTVMTRIARSIERRYKPFRFSRHVMEHFKGKPGKNGASVEDQVSVSAVEAMRAMKVRYILTPTQSGSTARRISRFKPDCWILGFSPLAATHEFLSLSYGVHPCPGVTEGARGWEGPVMSFVRRQKLGKKGDRLILTEGGSSSQTGTTDTIRFINLL